MREITDSTIEILLTPTDACRVAYTINNKQPVRSTFIGDEPLFFMNYEDEILEDDDLDIYLSEEIEDKINNRSLNDYEEKRFCDDNYNINIDFIDNISSINDKEESKNINELIEKIKLSNYASSLISEINIKNISYSKNIENSKYIKETRSILINPLLKEEDQLILLARELRRAWQHNSGVLIQPLQFFPDQAILVNRALEADIVSNMIRVIWDLHLGGYSQAWSRIENSSLFDVCNAFAKEANSDFRTLNNGKSLSVAFETWFISERCNKLDKVIIQQMLADDHGYIFGKHMNTSISLTNDLISSLGTVPTGKNYLSNYAHIITSDPLFNEIRDRANANFLWFIKFERSFRETEQELQNQVSDLDENMVREEQNERYSAEIINLPIKKYDEGGSRSNNSAEIIWIYGQKN